MRLVSSWIFNAALHMSTQLPRVSVVIPTHNRPHTLPRAIHSVLEQGFTSLEVIVVDDASRDFAARDVVARIAEQDPRVSYIRRLKGGSAAAARNTGIEAAKGEFVAFQDDDDEWLPGKLEKQIGLMDQLGPECLLVGGRLLRYIPDANPKVYLWPTAADGVWVDPKLFIDGFTAFLQTAVVRKSALDTVQAFNPAVPISEDFELALRLLNRGRLATVNDFVTTSYEQAETSLSNRRPLRIVSNLKIMELHGAQLQQYPVIVSILNYEVAINSVIAGDRRTAIRHWFRAFKANPRAFRVYLLMPMLILGGTAALAGIRLSQRIKKALGH
jgi:glycosyltransferase involved in cell wall biosynthesis